MNNISYAILVNDELSEITVLLEKLIPYTKENDEIVIVQDIKESGIYNVEVKNCIDNYIIKYHNIKYYQHSLNNNFADQKNFLMSKCNKDWIFNLDADEYPHENLLLNIHDILEMNTNVDVINIPRINIVNNISENHIKQWGWRIDNKGYINYPDMQLRIIKNNNNIIWKRPVHEYLIGYTCISELPQVDEYSLYHIKEISKQEIQNKIYSKIIDRRNIQ